LSSPPKIDDWRASRLIVNSSGLLPVGFFHEQASSQATEDQECSHDCVAGRGQVNRARQSDEFGAGEKKEYCQNLGYDDQVDDAVFILQIRDGDKVKQTETEEEQSCLFHQKGIIHLHTEKEGIESVSKKENERAENHAVQPNQEDTQSEAFDFFFGVQKWHLHRIQCVDLFMIHFHAIPFSILACKQIPAAIMQKSANQALQIF
jgi:hypothetical protein